MEEKVKELLKLLPSVEEKLGDPATVQDQKKFRELSQRHSYLTDLKDAWSDFERQSRELVENRSLLKEETDSEFVQVIQDDIAKLQEEVENSRSRIEALLVPPNPDDHANVIMELRAGTGGDEASIFVGDCLRMYRLFADKMGWKHETLSGTESEAGGYKEYILSLTGKNVHRFLQYEAGTHRVQRVPVTETQGRVHTSAITVAVLMEPREEEEIDIDESDLKIDTYRASGAGGQHVNTTDSAVRITHLPSGVVVYCMEERSQHKNKAKAMRVLAARLAEEQKRKAASERASLRSSQVGTGDRSERIRTYNFSQNRLTDHRINLTLYKLDQVMEGDLEEVCQTLVGHYYQEKLAAAGEDHA